MSQHFPPSDDNAFASSSKITLDSPSNGLINEEETSTISIPLEDHFVQFRELVDKSMRQEYDRLRVLTHESLPNAPLSKKPIHIANYSRTARANVLRLLALYRWKLESDLDESVDETHGSGLGSGDGGMNKTIGMNGSAVTGLPNGDVKLEQQPNPNSIVGVKRPLGAISKTWAIKSLFSSQNEQYKAPTRLIEQASSDVFARKIPNADIGTAVDVLTTGEWQRVPTRYKDLFERETPKTKSQVVETLEELDRALAFRMAVDEEIPRHLRIIRIADGRIYFRAEGLFKCAITSLGGWPSNLFLLDMEFLFHVKEGTTGLETFPTKMSKDTLNSFIEDTANHLLVSDPPPPVEEDADSSAVKGKRRNKALVRLFDVLQNTALVYQMQALWSQARRLERFEWKDKIRCSMAQDRKTMTITYWLRRTIDTKSALSRPKAVVPPPQHPPHGGTITISVQPERDILESIMGPDSCPRLALKVDWKYEPGALGLPIEHILAQEVSFEVDNQQLDVSDLLVKITRHHADVLIRSEYESVLRLLSEKPELRVIFETLDDFKLETIGGATCMTVRVYNTHWLQFQVNHTTGVLDVREARSALVSGLEKRIATMKTILGETPQRLLEQIYALKKQYVLEALEEKLEYVGIKPVHSLKGVPLEDLEHHGLGASINGKIRAKQLYVLSTPASKSHALVIVMLEPGFSYAFVGLRPGANGQTHFSQFAWLDVGKILQPNGSSRLEHQAPRSDTLLINSRSTIFEVSSSALRRIYAFSNAKVVLLQLERQLVTRSIPYQIIETKFSCLPTIQVKVKDLLPGDAASEISMENGFITVENWEDVHRCKVQTRIKLRRETNAINEMGSSKSNTDQIPGVRFDNQSSTLIFTPDSLHDHVGHVLSAWVSLSKLLLIAGQVNRISRRGDLPAIKLVSFSLDRVVCEYAQDHRVCIRFDPTSSTYDVSLGHAQPGSNNPHEPFKDRLVDRFNDAMAEGSVEAACVEFLSYLAFSLPCLKLMREMQGPVWPRLVIRDITSWLMLWQGANTRFGFEVALSPHSRRFLISDAAGLKDIDSAVITSLGDLTPVYKFKAYVQRAKSLAKGDALLSDQPITIIELDDGYRMLCDLDGITRILPHLSVSLNDGILPK